MERVQLVYYIFYFQFIMSLGTMSFITAMIVANQANLCENCFKCNLKDIQF